MPLGGAGESADGWAVTVDSRPAALVADGLAHGPAAAAASATAVSEPGRPQAVTGPGEFVLRAHTAMRGRVLLAYPGLLACDPPVIGAVPDRDHERGSVGASMLAARDTRAGG